MVARKKRKIDLDSPTVEVLSPEERKLIDECGKLYELVNDAKVDLEEMKKTLRALAKKKRKTVLNGNKYLVMFGNKTQTIVNSVEEVYRLVARKDLSIFFNLVTIKIGELRKQADGNVFEKITKTTSDPYGKVAGFAKIDDQ